MLQKTPKILLFFIAFTFVLNLIQSSVTELLLDEAYYWYYAQNLAWGYFDHPPMVAWMIALGSSLCEGELGVRLLSCVLYALNLLFIWWLIDHPKKDRFTLHYCVLVFAVTLMHAYGFLTLPDTPLLFFTTLFLLAYKRFITNNTLLNTVFLGLVMAAMMYSKYHGFLVIIFVLLSNIKLVFNRNAWLSVVISLICYLPHFLWLVQNDFISLGYHLSDRPNSPYKFADFTLGYIVNLMALFGLLFPWVYYALATTKIGDRFNRALVFLTYGFIGFFFISSFSRKVQAQWMIAISIPLIIITFNYLAEHAKARFWILRLGLANVVILLFLRVWLITGSVLPIPFETHYNKAWTSYIHDAVGDMPVVFENSYGNAAVYAFYTGATSYSLNNTQYRLNQYSLDNSEEAVQDKRVLYVSRYLNKGDLEFIGAKGEAYRGKYLDSFESFRKLQCIIPQEEQPIKPEQEISLKVYNPYSEDIDLNKLKFGVTFLNKYKRVIETQFVKVMPTDPQALYVQKKDTTTFRLSIPKPKTDEAAYLRMGISENGLYLGYNGKNISLK
ncbi:ArnT family glycosyltransferase [Arenibacter amylolyticus]|uniref:ArnT family glycosyltransferase n=1 Tax=Arenibacter amylolyticus TaxID=1406873 RepID=UPI000A3C9C63|nr:glycosyltransferase family 39 protein [Arenibacter amylolyticus]